jgi:type II secretory pathway pseudopilin PulG
MDKEAVEMRYLLGKLPDSEAAVLEERYFAEDGVFDEIETAEDDLVDAYVQGSLSREDRKRFENKLSGSARLTERVEFARLLSKTASPSKVVSHEPAKASWWQSLFAFSWAPNAALSSVVAIGLIVIVLGTPATFVWLRFRDERRHAAEQASIEQQRQQLEQRLSEQQAKTNQLAADLQNSQAEETRLQQELQATKEELARTYPQPIAPASITLSTSSRAPGSGYVLTVPATASTIQLTLTLESDDYASYQATIESSDGREILKKSGLRSRRSGQTRMIVWQFSSRLLSPGQYAVSVSGRTPSGTYDPVGEYSVRVVKK